MPAWIAVLRAFHIAGGMLALFVAPGAMLTVKGGRAHRRWGKIYFWSMAVVASTAMVLALYRPLVFLALIAVFSFYFAFRGYRVLLRKRRGPRAMDWLGAALALAGSLALLALGVHPLKGVPLPAPVVSIVFGVLGVLIAGSDVRDFVRPPADRNAWWYKHMGGMLGSYIATVSAFSVVNFRFLPTAVRWLWPTAIGVPGIFIWVGYYQRRFKQRPSAAAEFPSAKDAAGAVQS